jgi:hypothetical protein
MPSQALLVGDDVVVAIKESIDAVLNQQQYAEHKASHYYWRPSARDLRRT